MFKVILAIVVIGILFLVFKKLAWRLWKREGVQAVPKTVRNSLVSQFSLDADLLSRLRCREKGGRYMGQPVRYVGIFDPAQVKGTSRGVGNYAELLAGRTPLLFEARIWSAGTILVEDRRAGQAAF